MNQLPRHLADVALAVTIFLFGFVVNDLENGLSELVQASFSSVSAEQTRFDGYRGHKRLRDVHDRSK